MALKVAVVGCGGIGNTHGPIYLRNPQTDLLGYCDIIPERADKSAARDGVKKWYSIQEMLSDVGSDLDMVSVCSSSALRKRTGRVESDSAGATRTSTSCLRTVWSGI